MPHNICKEGLRSDTSCDGTSQVTRPTYSCPCPTDIRQPCRCSWITRQVRYLLLTLPGTFHPSCRHYRTSEIKKCGSYYINLHLLKSKLKLFYYRPELYSECRVILLHIPWEAKTPPDNYYTKVYMEDKSSRTSILFLLLRNHLGTEATEICYFLT
jgi:hypothetical protein